MFLDLFSGKQRTGKPADSSRRSRCLSVEPLEDRRLLSAAALHHVATHSRVASLASAVVAGHHATSTATTKAAASSAQTSTTTAAAAATTTTVAVSSATSTYSQQVTLTATVTTSGTGTLKGKVQFFDAGVAIGTVSLNSSGLATLKLSSLSVGDHTITATYLGNASFTTSTSTTPATLTVAAATTYTVVTTSANPIAPDDTLTLTARVLTAPTGTNTEGDGHEGGCGFRGESGSRASLPTGTINFQATDADGAVIDLGSAQVTNGVAKLSVSSLTDGNYTITATYTPGDGNYTASTSQAVSQSVSSTLSATAIRVSMSPDGGLAAGDAVTYTVTVEAKGSDDTSAAPTGTITFIDAVTGLALTESPITLTDGTATFSTTFTTNPIIVTYTPDATSSETYASSQVTLPLFEGRRHEGRGFGPGPGEGPSGNHRHDMALQSFMDNFDGFLGFA
jgi:large repetitive protein